MDVNLKEQPSEVFFMKFFEDDGNVRIQTIQEKTKQEYILKMVRHCEQRTEEAEVALGKTPEFYLSKAKFDLKDFFIIYEAIAASFRYSHNFDQMKLFDKNSGNNDEILNCWSRWYNDYLETTFAGETLQLFLLLARASSDLAKAGNAIKDNPTIKETQIKIIDRMNLPFVGTI